MADDELYDKRRGQRMLLTKWIKAYNSTDDDEVKERAAHKLADVLAWAKSVGMTSSEIVEGRDLPHRALELFDAGVGIGAPADDAEVRAAEREVRFAVDEARATRLGEGSGSVYVYGYDCVPDRLKIGRTDRDVTTRIVEQINESTPDRPVLHLVLATSNPGALERALHGALVLRNRAIEGGGREWYRTTVDEIGDLSLALGRATHICAMLNHHAEHGGDDMSTALEVPLTDVMRQRLRELAARSRKSEAEIAATLIEGALATDDLQVEIIRKRLAQADAGGPFVRHEDVLAWLKVLSTGQQVPPPKATITS